jgi:hypothetical protein
VTLRAAAAGFLVKRASRIAWALAVLGGVILVAAVVVRPEADEPTLRIATAVPFIGIGALLGSRRPSSPIGWLFLAFGVLAAIDVAAFQYAFRGLVDDPGSLPATNVAASVATHLWHPTFGLLVLAFLLFPNGQLLSPRWRWVVHASVVTYGGLAISGIFEWDFMGEGLDEGRFADVRPLFGGTTANVAAVVFEVLLVANLPLLLISAASLLVRLRRSTGGERQQIKWFVVPIALVLIVFAVGKIVLGDVPIGVALFPVVPIAAGWAILRHRLYDIDVVINRALVYGALTATLAGAYLGLVLLLGLVLAPLTSQSDLAITLSTLAIAALFRPARRRVQTLVNRRFFRHKYDAARTLELFGARLRSETDLDALHAELTRVVADTMQPAHVSLWLRERGG